MIILDSCRDCYLSLLNYQFPIRGEKIYENSTNKIFVLTDYPTKTDIRYNTLFKIKQNYSIKDKILYNKLENYVKLIPACLCNSSNIKYINHCSDNLINTIKEDRPYYILSHKKVIFDCLFNYPYNFNIIKNYKYIFINGYLDIIDNKGYNIKLDLEYNFLAEKLIKEKINTIFMMFDINSIDEKFTIIRNTIKNE